jgi:hypothetical protein
MENKAILDKLLNEQIVGFDLDEDTMPNTPRRLGQFAIEISQLSQGEIAVLIGHYTTKLLGLCNRCPETGSSSEQHWYLVYDGNVVLDRINRLIAELDRKLKAHCD